MTQIYHGPSIAPPTTSSSTIQLSQHHPLTLTLLSPLTLPLWNMPHLTLSQSERTPAPRRRRAGSSPRSSCDQLQRRPTPQLAHHSKRLPCWEVQDGRTPQTAIDLTNDEPRTPQPVTNPGRTPSPSYHVRSPTPWPPSPLTAFPNPLNTTYSTPCSSTPPPHQSNLLQITALVNRDGEVQSMGTMFVPGYMWLHRGEHGIILIPSNTSN
jgi:hypothetical protein